MKSDEVAELVRYRLEQAQDALADARYLLDGQRSPQSIVNRAYYAMFYATMALLQTIGKVPGKHAGVISLFDTEFALKGAFSKEYSAWLHRAFDMRQSTDYRVQKVPAPETVLKLIQQAETFISAVTEYLQNNTILHSP